VPKDRVLNALDFAHFKAHLEARKTRRKAMNKHRSMTRTRAKETELVR
jgi:hypothetical protein